MKKVDVGDVLVVLMLVIMTAFVSIFVGAFLF